jgi:hypothetical protein
MKGSLGGEMVLTVFGTTWREGADFEREAALSRRMAKVASRRPGFISYKSYVAPDGLLRAGLRGSWEALTGAQADISGPPPFRKSDTPHFFSRCRVFLAEN